MEIREATDNDIPGILKVLKASLGEVSSKKTEDIWRFKHDLNPFGRSLVLLAVEDSKIIGVRAFMQWKWQQGEQVFLSLRAVDTATHPKHQGKGIFKKLTLSAIEIAKSRNQLIFNTPNAQSKPGYLKMGWEEVGKLKVELVPVNPIKWRFGVKKEKYDTVITVPGDGIDEHAKCFNNFQKKTGKLFTPKSEEYLAWRYHQNPLQKYQVEVNEDFYFAGYIKKHKNFEEFRISEALYKNHKGMERLRKKALRFAEEYGVQLISVKNPFSKRLYTISSRGHFGPVLTTRNLDMEKGAFQNLLKEQNWSYSLGDLELF